VFQLVWTRNLAHFLFLLEYENPNFLRSKMLHSVALRGEALRKPDGSHPCGALLRNMLAAISAWRYDTCRPGRRCSPSHGRPQTNDADEPTDAIERRLRPAVWQVHLSPPIDPKRSLLQEKN